jgi:hypothetical protein
MLRSRGERIQDKCFAGACSCVHFVVVVVGTDSSENSHNLL